MKKIYRNDHVKKKCFFGAMLGVFVAGIFLSCRVLAAEGTMGFTVTVRSTCEFASSTGVNANLSVSPGQSYTIDGSELVVHCNNANGFAVSAIGYGDNTEGNTKMVSSSSADKDIVTGTSGTSNSWWAMKTSSVSGTDAVVVGDFSNYHVIPGNWTRVAYKTSQTTNTNGAGVQTTYKIYVASTQGDGTNTGKVKYKLVQPYNGS